MMDVLLEASVRSAVVAGLVGILLALVRPGRAAVRHAAWTAVLAAMLASPLLVIWRPALPVEMPRMTSIEQFTPASISWPQAIDPAPQALPAAGLRSADNLPATSSVPARPPSRPAPVSWSTILIAIWLAGAALLGLRLFVGWRMAARLVGGATPAALPAAARPTRAMVFESPAVAVPVLAGAGRGRIVLPVEWRSWPAGVLDTALAHEDAHARRRDPLVSFFARVNCCVFWFHPVAWWLELSLARYAEQACDDEVLGQGGEATSYAGMLVEMAMRVRGSGRRVVWHVGMAGRGDLARRVHRILAGRPGPLPARRAALLLTGALSAIAAGLGCQQQPAPLKPNPEYLAERAESEERTKHLTGVADMTAAEVAALEADVAANPDDRLKLERLDAFYVVAGHKMFPWNDLVPKRRAVILRLVEHHPESDAAGRSIRRAYDPEGYAAVKAAWLARTNRPDAAPKILANAAEFFSRDDKPLAESLLKRAIDLDPGGPMPRTVGSIYYPTWKARLGALYARALTGDDESPGLVYTGIRPNKAASANAYAVSVRKTLETLSDADILLATGQTLMRAPTFAERELGFDPQDLGRTYIDRAVALAPESLPARRLQTEYDRRARRDRVTSLTTAVRRDPSSFTSLPDQDRFELGAEIADRLYYLADGGFGMSPTETRDQLFETARRLAQEALMLADGFRNDDDYGTVVFESNTVLGLLALRDGDRRRAVEHLKAAAASPGSRELEYGLVLPSRLPTYLLNAGERESVAAFFDRLAELDRQGRDRWLADAKAVRGGFMTAGYQSTFGRSAGS